LLKQRTEFFPKPRWLPYLSTEIAEIEAAAAALADDIGNQWLVEQWLLLNCRKSMDSATVLKIVRSAMVTA